MSTYDSLIDTSGPWLRHQRLASRPKAPKSPAFATIAERLRWAGWQGLDRRASIGDVRPAVDRSECRQRVCTCHDDSAWRPGSYRYGCSVCGCDWRRERRAGGGR